MVQRHRDKRLSIGVFDTFAPLHHQRCVLRERDYEPDMAHRHTRGTGEHLCSLCCTLDALAASVQANGANRHSGRDTLLWLLRAAGRTWTPNHFCW
jgi:hypothetical protein